MKVKGNVSRSQTIDGSISKAELLALVRESIHVPEGATAQFYASSEPSHSLLHQHVMLTSQMQPDMLVPITDTRPIQFRITWSLPVGNPEQG